MLHSLFMDIRLIDYLFEHSICYLEIVKKKEMKMKFSCSFCGKVKEAEKISEKYVCEECIEKACLNSAALFGYEWWRKTLDSQNKDEIFIALLTIKECIRRSLIMKTCNQDWLIISDVAVVNLLMKFTSEICDFENYSICQLENGYSNFVNMILLARRYRMIIENIGLIHGKDVQLEDICFEPVQTDETERYFDIYLENGLYEKPEDYKIQNEGLLSTMNRKRFWGFAATWYEAARGLRCWSI